jgi:hypothetical protein
MLCATESTFNQGEKTTMNPSQIALQADRIAALCNVAARIANGENIAGGLISNGGVGSIAVNGTSPDVDIDVSDFNWNRRGVLHALGGAQTDVFSNAAASVKQNDADNTVGFPTATAAPAADEELKVVVIYGSDADNANPALQGISAQAWAATCAVPSDADVEKAHGNASYIKLGIITFKRAALAATVLTYDFDVSNRLDQRDHTKIDINKV